MREIETGHAGRGPHGQALGQRHANLLFHVEEGPQGGFVLVIRAGGIAGCGADAPVAFGNQGIVVQRLFRCISPMGGADLAVQPFGSGFRKSVGEGLGQNFRVVVVILPEGRAPGFEAMACGDAESADVVRIEGRVALRGNEVGEASLSLRALLAKEMQGFAA